MFFNDRNNSPLGSLNNRDKEEAVKTSDALFYGSICSFISGLFLLMSFSSPYWLASWEETQSPFKNMGLWEMCFYRFRHPDYQFDYAFSGCHPIYGTEYRLIREKLLPGWLMVVQLFITLALISSFLGQTVMVPLLLRYPLKIILRFEHQFCVFVMACYGCTAVFIFLGISTFGGECWSRDWLLYPNFNYVSWSFAFALFACLGHILSTVLFYMDSRLAKERKEKTKALIMQMQPPGFASTDNPHHGFAAYM
ncbi:uncharacterized protein pck [Lepeophtheirus salmonis]|uniref:Putative LOC100741262 [Bombus impatiens] n=1 Tax=Lepeophtheirus salmonis TaxID=72036 RepID=A0A0K2T862_LEPSM|nr:uncharacterized protein LOC121130597 [Lepeophtheirus salmonis]